MLRGAGAGGSAASHFVCLEKSFFTTIGCGLAGTGSLLAGAVLMIAGVGFARAGLGFGSTETSSGCWAGLSLTSTCFGAWTRIAPLGVVGQAASQKELDAPPQTALAPRLGDCQRAFYSNRSRRQ